MAFDNNKQLKKLRLAAISKARGSQQEMTSLMVNDCVLYHSGLQRRNIFADIKTGVLTGVVE
jgi:hypothetical protein